MRSIGVLALSAVLLAATSSATLARRQTLAPRVVAVPDAPEGIGCYFERGRTYCSHYCYIEADGHRFCSERARDAHSQAPTEELPVIHLTPMK
ncbi:MAG: hypothetical protein ABL901_16560 [Hyphomicrobiaceae bacterium]